MRNSLSHENRDVQDVPAASLANMLMRLPARGRLETILEREDAEAVVASLAAEDFYLTVQELGPDDSFPLLALGTIEQLDFLFDLSWWMKEDVQPARALEWLERLGRANEMKFVSWFYEADFSLLVWLFKRWITAAVIPEDIDPIEAIETLPKNTLDDLYYWECRYPQYEDLMKRVLSLLFEVNHEFYRELLDHVMWSLDSEMEEEAFRLHKERLDEHAIPDYYDALSIYAAPPRESRARTSGALAAEDVINIPAFALAVIPKGDLLERVLQSAPIRPHLSAFCVELAALANKIVVADQLAPENPESLRRAADKATATLNLGLDLVSGGDETLAASLLLGAYTEDLFRTGHAALNRVKNRLERVRSKGWMSRWSAGISALDGEWYDTAEALLGKTPKFPDLSGRGSRSPRSGFIRDRLNLAEASGFVEMIEALDTVGKALEFDLDTLASALWEEGQIQGIRDLTLGVLVFTAAASSLMGREWRVDPLPLSEWPRVHGLLTPAAMRRTLDEWLESVALNSPRRAAAQTYFEPLLAAYEAEAASFSASEPPDPAFVRYFIFREG